MDIFTKICCVDDSGGISELLKFKEDLPKRRIEDSENSGGRNIKGDQNNSGLFRTLDKAMGTNEHL